ncbi:type II toxin-antitoxin system HicA family toxin [Aestuariivirga sp.]|uniref:type II toxin-antitoxin system HicA family toxin n=1 Tax=Aestuariivirga sp. TaxID=2650926 RepID=UPI0039E6FD1F
MKRLEADGWTVRGGKGDHVNYTKPGVRELITIDTGRREIGFGILRRIYKIAGWKW